MFVRFGYSTGWVKWNCFVHKLARSGIQEGGRKPSRRNGGEEMGVLNSLSSWMHCNLGVGYFVLLFTLLIILVNLNWRPLLFIQIHQGFVETSPLCVWTVLVFSLLIQWLAMWSLPPPGVRFTWNPLFGPILGYLVTFLFCFNMISRFFFFMKKNLNMLKKLYRNRK